MSWASFVRPPTPQDPGLSRRALLHLAWRRRPSRPAPKHPETHPPRSFFSILRMTATSSQVPEGEDLLSSRPQRGRSVCPMRSTSTKRLEPLVCQKKSGPCPAVDRSAEVEAHSGSREWTAASAPSPPVDSARCADRGGTRKKRGIWVSQNRFPDIAPRAVQESLAVAPPVARAGTIARHKLSQLCRSAPNRVAD